METGATPEDARAEMAGDATDAHLSFSRALLCERLRDLKDAAAMAPLRAMIAALQAELNQSDSPLRTPRTPDDTIDFNAAHLSAELEQIAAAHGLERAGYYLDRLIRGVTEARTSPINDINLNRWKEYADIYTDSLWLVERRDNSGAHTAGYWGNFIPQIPYQMMRRYTRPGEWVLDTFAGAGTTLIEGQRLGRNTLGIELQADVAAQARRLIAAEPNQRNVVAHVEQGDSATCDYRELLERYGQRAVQLVLMHPPYFDIIKFSADPADLSNAPSVEAFLAGLGQVVAQVAPVLERGRYLALVIGDKYADGEWIPLGFLAMQEVQRRGFLLKSIVVKNFEETAGKRNQKELWVYRALVGGFYIFKHEYIFIFKKR